MKKKTNFEIHKIKKKINKTNESREQNYEIIGIRTERGEKQK